MLDLTFYLIFPSYTNENVPLVTEVKYFHQISKKESKKFNFRLKSFDPCDFFFIEFSRLITIVRITIKICPYQHSAISALNCKPLKLDDQYTYFGSNISSIESNVYLHEGKTWTAIDYMKI